MVGDMDKTEKDMLRGARIMQYLAADRITHISRATAARLAECSKQTITPVLSELVKYGWLEQHKVPCNCRNLINTSFQYTLAVSREDADGYASELLSSASERYYVRNSDPSWQD